LGIDIGHVASIAQVGAPPGIASLKQRLGRSGRREGTAQILRQYLIIPAVNPESSLTDLLRLELVQTVATIELLLRGVFEPAVPGDLHLSTLVQQLLSTIYQTGGVSAAEAYARLVSEGAFTAIDQPLFTDFLRDLGKSEVISQASDGTLLPGRIGEKIAEHYTFFAAFASNEEYKVVTENRTLGTLPISNPLVPGSLLIFGGRRWLIISVDDTNRMILVTAAGGGVPPIFNGTGRPVGELVRGEMRRILITEDIPAYLDATAARELAGARAEFSRLGLDRNAAVMHKGDVWFVLWEGDRVLDTLSLALRSREHFIELFGPCVGFGCQAAETVCAAIKSLAANLPVDPVDLTEKVGNLLSDKHDEWLSRPLLRRAFAARHLDLDGVIRLLAQLTSQFDRKGGFDRRLLSNTDPPSTPR
jgi:ATP-dependent Lhr-like helicase